MSRVLPITFIVFVILSLFLISPHRISAQDDAVDLPGPPDTEGWYCKNVGYGLPGEIWHQIPSTDPNQLPTQFHQDDCSADEQCAGIAPPNDTYFGDVACLKTGNDPIKGTGTQMYSKPPNPTKLTQFQFQISSNKMLEPVCYQEIDLAYLKAVGKTSDCSLTSPTKCGCDMKYVQDCTRNANGTETCVCTRQEQCGPGDWRDGTFDCSGTQIGFNPNDNQQCTTTFTCTAQSVGTFDIAFRPPDQACWQDLKVTISPPNNPAPPPDDNCAVSQKNITAPRQDANILADSLNDELDNEEKMSILLPDSVYNEVALTCTDKNDPYTGVSDAFTSILCAISRAPVLGGILAGFGRGNLCPKEVQYQNQKTNCLHWASLAVENRTRPPELNAPPQRQACEIQDYLTTGSQQTVGNQYTDSISSQIGGPQGVYTEDTPILPDYEYDISQNLYTDGKVFDGDLRVPDINSRCKVYSGANLYASISFCADDSLLKAGNSPISGTTAGVSTSCPVPGGTITTHSYSFSPTNGHCSPGYSLEGNCTVCPGGAGIGVSRRANAIDVATNGKAVVLPTLNGQTVQWTMVQSYPVAAGDGGGNGYTFQATVGSDTYTLDLLHMNTTSLQKGQSYPSGTTIGTTTIDHVHMTMGKNIGNNVNIGSVATDCDTGWMPSEFLCDGSTANTGGNGSVVIGANGDLLSFIQAAANQFHMPAALIQAFIKVEAPRTFDYSAAELAQFSTPGWWNGLTANASTLSGNDPSIIRGYAYNTCAYTPACAAGADVRGVTQFLLQTFNSVIAGITFADGHTPDRRIIPDAIMANSALNAQHAARHLASNRESTRNLGSTNYSTTRNLVLHRKSNRKSK
jgi:hypothetical protein